MLKGFRQFIMRGNVLDLAVAVVIGAAFGAVVTSFVTNILTPLIAAIVGKPDFSAIKLTPRQVADLAASFQVAVVDSLVKKSVLALKKTRLSTLCVGGGVAAVIEIANADALHTGNAEGCLEMFASADAGADRSKVNSVAGRNRAWRSGQDMGLQYVLGDGSSDQGSGTDLHELAARQGILGHEFSPHKCCF